MSNVTSIKARKAIKATVTSSPVTGNDFVLQHDIQAATKYVADYLTHDNAIENAEREFCKAFAHNHEGHLKPAIKAGFAAIKASGVFDGLSTQSVDNLSSAAQWIALQPYNTQDELFEAGAFRKAYHAARWPVASAPSQKQDRAIAEPHEVVKVSPRASQTPTKAKPSHNEACNEIAMELNAVIEHINNVINAYPAHIGNESLGTLALDIGRAIEKAAHARLQQASSHAVAA